MLDLDKLDLDAIASALADQTDYEYHHLIDPQTGEMGFWTSELGIDGENQVDLEDVDMIVIEPLPSSVWYRDMVDFAVRVSDEKAGRRLTRALDGRGAFRRFGDELHEEFPELLTAWRAFQDNRRKRRAVDWLAEQALIGPAVADRYRTENPEPAVP